MPVYTKEYLQEKLEKELEATHVVSDGCGKRRTSRIFRTDVAPSSTLLSSLPNLMERVSWKGTEWSTPSSVKS
ncbi:uncharacterized protein LOC144120899 isoform X3 [Amblyomma americanum]